MRRYDAPAAGGGCQERVILTGVTGRASTQKTTGLLVSTQRASELAVYSASSERLKDFRVRVRSDFAINTAAGFMNLIQP